MLSWSHLLDLHGCNVLCYCKHAESGFLSKYALKAEFQSIPLSDHEVSLPEVGKYSTSRMSVIAFHAFLLNHELLVNANFSWDMSSVLLWSFRVEVNLEGLWERQRKAAICRLKFIFPMLRSCCLLGRIVELRCSSVEWSCGYMSVIIIVSLLF